MICSLSGDVQYRGTGYFELSVAGVGYTVWATAHTVFTVPAHGATVVIYHNLREDASDLYGFLSRDERDLFTKLLSVSGVGPKTALHILDAAGMDTIVTAVKTEDIRVLTTAPGVGKKTAERLVLELKNKLDAFTVNEAAAIDTTVLDALIGLGYEPQQARDALKDIDQSLVNTEEKIKAALAYLTA